MTTLARSCFVLSILLRCAGPVFAAGDPDLLPPDRTVTAWSRSGAPKVYEGPALYDHIDGGGEAFLELGFEACTVQKYTRGQEELTLEIYRMADSAAALGSYVANCGRETPSPALDERHTAGQNQLIMVKGRFYVVVTLGPTGKNGSPALLDFAKYTAQRIPSGPPPGVLALLPKEGLMPGSVRIARGPLGLSAVATLGEGDILQLGRKVTAVSGDYPEKNGGSKTMIVADYPSPEAAAAALAHLRENLDRYLKALDSSPDSLVFQDYKGHYGFAGVRGSRLVVQVGFLDKPAP